MNKGFIGTTGLIIAFALLVGVNIVSNIVFSRAKVDLTEGKIYTLSEGTKNIVDSIDETITLRFFYSEKVALDIPMIHSYAMRVEKFLKEYEAIGGGKIKLEIVDPQPFSEEEDGAVAAGMQAVPKNANESIYFGLEGHNKTDQQQAIPFFVPDREQFLEYDISRMIYNLVHPERRKMSVITSLPVDGKEFEIEDILSQNQQDRPWLISRMMRELFDVTYLEPKFTSIPADTDLLLLIHPKGLSPVQLHQIDQYVLRGGKIIVFIDIHAEEEKVDLRGVPNALERMTEPRVSELPFLLETWGVQMVPEMVAADRGRAQAIPTDSSGREIVPYIFFPMLKDEDLNSESYITNGLDGVTVWAPGVLRQSPNATTTFTPLIKTSKDSALIDAVKARFFPDPKELLRNFQPDDQEHVLAAIITGTFNSAFGDKPPADGAGQDHLARANEENMVLIVADVDMLADKYWSEIRRMPGGQEAVIPHASNADFLANAIDFLSGSRDLISLRTRNKFQRPFTVVEELKTEAHKKYFAQQEELQQSLTDLQKKIRDSLRQDASGQTQLVLSPEQRAEVERFRDQEVATRKKLREVRHSLGRDVETLGTKLKLINIGLMPLFVGLFAVAMGFLKVRRRRRR